jgi:hypothetical protein
VAPLHLGGMRGKQSTPSDWMAGTSVVSTIGERERHGAGVAQSARSSFKAGVKATVRSLICRVECFRL